MRILPALALLGAAACSTAAPQRPLPPNHSAPAAAQERILRFSIVSAGHRAGKAELRIEPDGRRLGHFVYADRGRGPDVRSERVLDRDGVPVAYRATGVSYSRSPVDERLEEAGNSLRWQSTSEHGEAPRGAGWYLPLASDTESLALLARVLLRRPDHRIALLPVGQAWIEGDVRHDIVVAGTRRQLRQVAIGGVGFTPKLVWLDENDEIFATASPWLSVFPVGADAVIPALLAADRAWTAARAANLAGRFAHRPPAAGLAITHARLYDSERRAVVPDTTVIIVGDRIAAVGPATTTPIPTGARVIDARGRTLIPGLWDMHVHLSEDDGLLDLASGVTTVRDLGNDMTTLDAQIARFEAGSEIGPHALRAGLIDGPGPATVPTGVVASTPEEAGAAVARYAAAGYVQIKIYGSVSPPLVPGIAADAHARGMRVSGHIPLGMTPTQAVAAGYDEIQHIDQVMRQLLRRADDPPTKILLMREVPDRMFDFDPDGPAFREVLDMLVAHHTVVDPTLTTYHGMFVSEPGEFDPELAPYEHRLPAQIERAARRGGVPAPGGKRDRFRAGYARFLRMVKLAWDRKIPIVAGTDSVAGLALSHELELYVQAGIPAPEVLSLATIGSARIMGHDKLSGSIAVGKHADVVLVDGDPTRDIATVRNTDLVVCRGVTYEPAELFAAVGMAAR